MRAKVATRLKAVIYARVSSKEQEAEGFSVDAQLRLLRAYAAEQGFDVGAEFLEAETAKQSGRSAFGKMLKFLQEHTGHVILVEKVDRLYRNFADYVKVDHIGVELHFVKDGMVISESSKSQDKFMHGIRVLMAKNYVDNLSEEIRKGLNEKAAQGIYPTHAPLGYLNAIEPGTKRKMIVPDPARAPLIKALFERYAAGSESYETLAKFASKAGLTSKKGRPLPKSAIEQILKHPAYCGIIRWNGIDSAGVHEPLVSKEIWQRVQDIREGRFNKNTGFGAQEFIYRGILRCKCEKVMTGELKKGQYVYYHCTGQRTGLCDRPYVSESKITEAFSELLERISVPEEWYEGLENSLRKADADRLNSRAKKEHAARAEIQSLKSRLEKPYSDKLEGEITVEFFRETRKKWEAKITDLQLELAALDRAEPISIDETMQILELAKNAHISFKEANSEQKRELLNFVLSNSSWIDGKLVVNLNEWFDLMLNLIEMNGSQRDREVNNHLVEVISENWWR